MEKTLIIDVGNTATEVAVFEGEKKIDFIGFYKLPFDKNLLNSALAEYKKKNIAPGSGMIFSVAPKNVSLIEKLVKKNFGFTISVFDWKNYELKNKSKKITEPIGADLLADIKAAEKFHNGSALVADCGTITKLLYLGNDSKFIGLSMIPGIETMMKEFNQNTAHLPDIDKVIKPNENVGINTYESMCHGVFWSTISYIKEVFNNVKDKDTKLIITGGNSRLIKDEFPGACYDLFLTLKGMYILYKEVSK